MKLLSILSSCLLGIACFCGAEEISQQSPHAIVGSVPKEILETHPEIQELNEDHFQKKNDHGKEVIYELFTGHDGLGWNAVIADIQESVPHFHKRTTEVYTVLNGTLEVFINDVSHVLNPGDVIVIPLNSVHWGRSLTDKPARIMCICVPAWCPQDHHIVE